MSHPSVPKTPVQTRTITLYGEEYEVTEYTVKPRHGPAFAYSGNTGLSGEDATRLRLEAAGLGHTYKPVKERIADGKRRRARAVEIAAHGAPNVTRTESEIRAEVVRALGEQATPEQVALVVQAMAGNVAVVADSTQESTPARAKDPKTGRFLPKDSE